MILLRHICLTALLAVTLSCAAETAAERHARYHDPDFRALAAQMVDMCHQQARKCISEELIYMSNDDYAALAIVFEKIFVVFTKIL